MHDLCQKLCQTVGGAFSLINNFTELKNVMETFATLAGTTIKLNYEFNEEIYGSTLIHVDSTSFRNMIMKQNNISFMTIGELSDILMFQENWPFLDDFVANAKMEKIPIRNSHPTIQISREPKILYIPERFPYDIYRIYNPEFLQNFFKATGIHMAKINEYRNLIWPIKLSTGVFKQSFAAIRLGSGILQGLAYNNLIESLNELPFSMDSFYAKKYPSIWIEFIVLPYNYEELFGIIRKGRQTNFTEELYNYVKNIPLFYHNYLQILSDSLYKWGINIQELVFFIIVFKNRKLKIEN